MTTHPSTAIPRPINPVITQRRLQNRIRLQSGGQLLRYRELCSCEAAEVRHHEQVLEVVVEQPVERLGSHPRDRGQRVRQLRREGEGTAEQRQEGTGRKLRPKTRENQNRTGNNNGEGLRGVRGGVRVFKAK